MAEYKITFQPADSYIWDTGEWKDYVCEDFDANVVIVGNRDYPEIENADWWVEADNVLSEMDNYDKEEFIDWFSDEYDAATLEKLSNVYNDYYDKYGGYPDDTISITMMIAMILRPGLQLKQTTIRGSVQGDWDYAVYVDGCLDPYELADWFFGNVTDVNLMGYDPSIQSYEYQYSTPVANSVLWNMTDEEIAGLFDLSADEVEIERD